ncbi:MAG TPA: inositol monophosphatase [Nitrososphaera sp.]|nr:inositol monophosphatase [Nitrososphaera sp.]
MDLDDVLTHSLVAGRQAGRLLIENFGRSHQVSIKRDNSFVTQVDRESQELILKYLKEQFADVEVVAEEQDTKINQSVRQDGYYFVVDPLDGTATFVSGIPFFCVSIALCKGSETLTGVLVDPSHGEEFSAITGEGAFLNGKRISVTKRSRMEELTLNVNHTKFDTQTFEAVSKNVLRKIKRFHKLGSLCLEVAYVAAGRLDGTINNELSMWDIAASGLILEEAGGIWTTLDGTKPRFPVFEKLHICASNKLIHDQLLRAVKLNESSGNH